MFKPKSAFGRPVELEDCKLSVGPGWQDLIEECYNLCVKYEVNILQVKEKFGTLRFYTGAAAKEFHDKISDICARSANICESCGDHGELIRIGGWYYTYCGPCTNKLKKARGIQ